MLPEGLYDIEIFEKPVISALKERYKNIDVYTEFPDHKKIEPGIYAEVVAFGLSGEEPDSGETELDVEWEVRIVLPVTNENKRVVKQISVDISNLVQNNHFDSETVISKFVRASDDRIDLTNHKAEVWLVEFFQRVRVGPIKTDPIEDFLEFTGEIEGGVAHD
ncbi:MAG: hypothetical protein HRU19_29040 [Pseudobacteriovorax sp.]|nr:hypothetical protein [Pseudobacteriovorax sp.]